MECPDCRNQIDHLDIFQVYKVLSRGTPHYSKRGVVRLDVSGHIDLVSDQFPIIDDEMRFSCPICGYDITDDEAEAEALLADRIRIAEGR